MPHLARQARIFRLDLRKNLRPLPYHFSLDRALDSNDKAIPGSNKFPIWCGILALWLQNATSNGDGTWPPAWLGPTVGADKPLFMLGEEMPCPGDTAYLNDRSHHDTVVRVVGNLIMTVEGNTRNYSSILLLARERDKWTGFLRAVPKGKG